MNALLAFGLGGQEIVLILVVVLLLFGAKKIPELARGLGNGIKEFKKATNDINEEVQHAMDQPANSNTNASSNQAQTQQPQQSQVASTPNKKDDAPKA